MWTDESFESEAEALQESLRGLRGATAMSLALAMLLGPSDSPTGGAADGRSGAVVSWDELPAFAREHGKVILSDSVETGGSLARFRTSLSWPYHP